MKIETLKDIVESQLCLFGNPLLTLLSTTGEHLELFVAKSINDTPTSLNPNVSFDKETLEGLKVLVGLHNDDDIIFFKSSDKNRNGVFTVGFQTLDDGFVSILSSDEIDTLYLG